MSTEPRPIVVVTRTSSADRGFARALVTCGLWPVSLPTVTIGAIADPAPLRAALADLGTMDWVVFTSAHAVAAACAQPEWRQRWPAHGRRPRIAAVGPATAARLAARRLPVDLVPTDASAADLARALASAQDIAGARILWPRSDLARPELAAMLRASGAVVIDPPAYRTIPMRPRALAPFVRELEAGRIDAVAFMSPSSASGLAGGLPGGTLQPLRGRTAVASIGPTTSAALVGLGAPPDVQPRERTSESLAAAIAQHLAARSGAPV